MVGNESDDGKIYIFTSILENSFATVNKLKESYITFYILIVMLYRMLR